MTSLEDRNEDKAELNAAHLLHAKAFLRDRDPDSERCRCMWGRNADMYAFNVPGRV